MSAELKPEQQRLVLGILQGHGDRHHMMVERTEGGIIELTFNGDQDLLKARWDMLVEQINDTFFSGTEPSAILLC